MGLGFSDDILKTWILNVWMLILVTKENGYD